MKTRIIHTKIWEDDFFKKLSKPARYLFMYLITNYRINLCGIYELSDEIIIFETGLKKKGLEKLKKEMDSKVKFFENWVYVVNAKRLGGYRGKLCDQGISKEMELIPDFIKKCLIEGKCDTPLIPPARGTQGTRNNKQEIRNKKEGDLEKKFTLSKKDIEKLKDKFPNIEVELECEKAKDYLLSNGGVKKNKTPVKDYLAYLRNWMRSDWVKKKPIVHKVIERDDVKFTPEEIKKNKAKIEEAKSKIREKLNFKRK